MILFNCYDLCNFHLKILVHPGSPLNGSKESTLNCTHASDANKSSFKCNSSKKKVRLRVISTDTSTSRSWYQSTKIKKLSSRKKTKANIEVNTEKTAFLFRFVALC